MKFISNGNQIECYRIMPNRKGGGHREIRVVSFDEEQESIPPHVAASLSSIELKRLKEWMEDRQRLNAKLEKESFSETLLDTMPDLLKKSQQALNNVKVIDIELYRKLKNQLREFDELLNHYQSISSKSSLEIKKMQEDEVLKEKLKSINQSL